MITLKRQFNDVVLKEIRGNFLLRKIKLPKVFKSSSEFLNYLKRMLNIQDNEVYDKIVGGYMDEQIKNSGSFIN